MSTNLLSPVQSDVSKAPEISQDAAAPSPLHAEAISLLSTAPKFNPANTLGKTGKADTASQILNEMDYAEKSIVSPSEKLPTLHSIADVSAPAKQEPKFDKAATSQVVQDGVQYLDFTDPYSDAAKAAGNRALGIA